MQKNMETEQLSGILALQQQKKPFLIGELVKKNWENDFQGFKGQFGLYTKNFF